MPHFEIARVEQPDEALERKQLARRIAVRLGQLCLRPLEWDVLYRRLMATEPETLSTLASRHYVCRESVRQVEKRLLLKLRDSLAEFADAA